MSEEPAQSLLLALQQINATLERIEDKLDERFHAVQENQHLIVAALDRHNTLLEGFVARAPESKLPTNRQRPLPLRDAWQALGYKNYHQCWRRIRSGHYRIGHEVFDRRSPNSPDPQYWLDIDKCLERDRVLPAKRRA